MNGMLRAGRNESDQRLRRRIFNVLQAGTYRMDRLLRLFDIAESRECETACVEVKDCPRLLVNPDFASAHCSADEHLFMLVLHELNHVLLGHTRLFGRATPLHNIAFDAVINAQLCWEFPRAEFSDFFRSLNSADAFPGRLLRPPRGWPNHLAMPSDAGRRERRVLQALYGKDQDPAHVTYHEIFELLFGLLREKGGPAWATPRLVGDHSGRHGDSDADRHAAANEALRSGLREIVERWPRPRHLLPGRDMGRDAADTQLRGGSVRETFRRACARLFRRAGVYHFGQTPRQHRADDEFEVLSPLPELRDRRAHVWAQLTGTEPLLFRSTLRAPRPRRNLRPAHVYLDVSGSMDAMLPDIVSSLSRARRDGACRVYAFSTVVSEIGGRGLENANTRTTGGTDIECVYAHVLQYPPAKRPKAVVVITDGYTGKPRADQAEAFARERVRLHVGLVGRCAANDLKPFAYRCETLPWEAKR